MVFWKNRNSVVVLFLGLILIPTQAWAEKKDYVLGVFPFVPLAKLEKAFSPVAKDLELTLDKKVELRSKPTFTKFSEEIRNQSYDIAFVQPFDYVTAHDKYGYLPLARRNTPLNGVILVSIDSDISSIEQLKGKVVSSPPEVSALAHLTNMALSEKGINAKKDVTRIYAKNHFACMQAVLLGKAQACGTAKRAMAQFEDKEMSKRFKIIAQTPKIPHSLFVVHSRVSKDEREMLKNRIITWEKTATGKQILERSNLVPFVEAHDKEYNVVRNYLKTN